MSSRKLGFIGLGIMGRAMAENLLKSGSSVTVYNRTRARAEEMKSLGARVADTAADAARGSDVVISMVSDPAAVRDVILGHGGAVEGLGQGAVLIDCSTIDPKTTMEVSEAARSRGASFLDAPVTGSKIGAEKGELIMIVGGTPELIASVQDVFDVISKKVVIAGPTGSGVWMKLCFNTLVGQMIVGISQAVVTAKAAGLDPRVFLDLVMSGAIQSPFYAWKGGCILDRDFSTNFSTKLMRKDADLAIGAARDLGIPLIATESVRDALDRAIEAGYGEDDMCSYARVLEQLAGVEAKD